MKVGYILITIITIALLIALGLNADISKWPWLSFPDKQTIWVAIGALITAFSIVGLWVWQLIIIASDKKALRKKLVLQLREEIKLNFRIVFAGEIERKINRKVIDTLIENIDLIPESNLS